MEELEEGSLSHFNQDDMKEINQRILSFATISPGQKEWLPIPALLDHVLGMVANKISAREIAVTTTYQPVPEIRGTAAQLLQVFMNLIMNGIDSAPHGGWMRTMVYRSISFGVSKQSRCGKPGSAPRTV